MNSTKQPMEKTSWWHLAILGILILASWVLAIVLLPKLGKERSPASSPTPTQFVPPSATAQITMSATAPGTATLTPHHTIAPATATPTTPVPADEYCISIVDSLNVRSGPGTTNRVLVQIQANERVIPVARNSDGTWIQVIVGDSLQGWVSAEYLRCEGLTIMDLPVIVVLPTLTETANPPTLTPMPPTSTPQVFQHWRGEYYGNADLAGAPVLLRDDEAIEFDWGYGSPAQGVSTDHFSIRWTKQVHFSEGRYRFRLEADDGVRLWVAGNLLIDRWKGGSAVDTVDQRIWTGTHEVVLEYFELEGIAKAKLTWDKPVTEKTPKPTPTPTQAITEWRAEYYDNDKLQGAPRVVRNEREIAFNWRSGGPAPQLDNDYFSARFTRQLSLPAGIYRWSVAADDGVRVYIDGQLVIDAWREGTLAEHIREVPITEGTHSVRIDYMEKAGFAALYVHWEKLAATVTPTLTVAPPTTTPKAAPPTAAPTSVPPTATLAPSTATPTLMPLTATPTLAPPTAAPTEEPTMTTTPTSAPRTVTPTAAPEQSVPFRTILQGNQSFKFVRKTAYRAFETRAQWDEWVESQGGQLVALPGVDWESKAVFAAFLDPQLDLDLEGSSIGVEITEIRATAQTVLVEVSMRKVAPAGGRPGTGARAVDGPDRPRALPGTPYHIVVVARGDLPSGTRIPVYFAGPGGQVLGTDALGVEAGTELGPETRPGVRKARDAF